MPKIFNKRLVNAHNMVHNAYNNHYAIAHFNINDLEWTKAILTSAQENNTPIIIATSEGAIKYMGGLNTIVGMVLGMMEDLNITVPVALHLDHGQSIEMAEDCIKHGYSSVMFDGSSRPFDENYKLTKELVAFAKPYDVSVEAEIGTIGGEEDGVIGEGELGDPVQAKKFVDLGIDFLAAGIGNIHGMYPKNWKGLSFETEEKIEDAIHFPLVLHGGSGVPQAQVKKAISLGVAKVNINTELQIAFAAATRKYIEAKKDITDAIHTKGYDPRKLLKPGYDAIMDMCKELTTWMGSKGKASAVDKQEAPIK